jgi:hypothetical protein
MRAPTRGAFSLDAIHLATALGLGDLLDGFYTYDTRLIEAATQAGLRVLAPCEESPEPQEESLEPQ